MSIKQAYREFQEYYNAIWFDNNNINEINIYKIGDELKGTRNRFHDDVMRRRVDIGDIVSYGNIGSYKGLSIGVVLGFTESGFRVAKLYRDSADPCFNVQELQTPGTVALLMPHKDRT